MPYYQLFAQRYGVRGYFEFTLISDVSLKKEGVLNKILK